jgi:hypothetical protein
MASLARLIDESDIWRIRAGQAQARKHKNTRISGPLTVMCHYSYVPLLSPVWWVGPFNHTQLQFEVADLQP